jgi:hypothetical protein
LRQRRVGQIGAWTIILQSMACETSLVCRNFALLLVFAIDPK